MILSDAVYLGFPAACFVGMLWLAWEARKIHRPEFDEYNRRMDEADRGWDEFEAELQMACDRYVESVN